MERNLLRVVMVRGQFPVMGINIKFRDGRNEFGNVFTG